MDVKSCHQGTASGTPFAILPIMTMGEQNGIMLPQTAVGLFGVLTLVLRMTKERMIGMVIGNINDWASCGSSFTTLPTAANKDA